MSQKKKPFWLIYFLGFLWALSLALPAYVQSSYIGTLVGIERTGLVVGIGYAILFVAILAYQWFIKRFGNYKVAVVTVVVALIATGFLMIGGTWVQLLMYLLLVTTLGLIPINNDIFLEHISDDRTTGRTRTTMLTFINIAFVMSPLIMGYVVGDSENFRNVYLIGGLALLPVLLLLLYQRKLIDDAKTIYQHRSFQSIKKVFEQHPNIPRIMHIEYTLRFFYGIMVLYTPIYLNQTIGFDWPTIGGIFTIMLLPFILVEMPAGKIADKYIGEKEMLIAGIILMALFSLSVAFVSDASFALWAFILFMTRVGAALLESMNETYFFKHVNAKDMDLIDLFRDLRPLGWLSAALVASAVLAWTDMIEYVFIVLAIVIITALTPALRLKDTK